jgi:dynein heavy chain 2
MTYLSREDEKGRATYVEKWQSILSRRAPVEFSFTKFMINESDILELVSQGLPNDDLTIENSLMVTRSTRTSLIIDPNGGISSWILKKFEDKKGTEIVLSQDKKLQSKLELGIRFGKTFIIKEIDQIDAMLVPLLKQDFTKQGPRVVINVGEKLVDWNETFKLYLLTRDHTIDLPPTTSALINLVNNTVTSSGLEQQLLSAIILHELPEIETKKRDLLTEERNLKLQLDNLEKRLLNL